MRGTWVALGMVALAGCPWPEAPHEETDPPDTRGCSDVDGDGFGVGAACMGADCDDSNPDVFDPADCEAQCSEDPHATACPCNLADTPEPEICYEGPPGTLGVGPCVAGLRMCDVVRWGSCQGQVLPTSDDCDDVDNDCDGEVDELVQTEWEDCDWLSECTCFGHDCDAFGLAGAENVGFCPEDSNCLTLVDPSSPGTLVQTFEHAYGGWASIKFVANVPPSAALRFDVRWAASAAELIDAQWTFLGEAPPDDSPLDLYPIGDDYYSAVVLEVRVTFTTPGDSPRLSKLGGCRRIKI